MSSTLFLFLRVKSYLLYQHLLGSTTTRLRPYILWSMDIMMVGSAVNVLSNFLCIGIYIYWIDDRL